MPNVFSWNIETPSVLTAVTAGADACPPVHLLTEAAPGGGWDWAAWCKTGARAFLHGNESSQVGAMKKAEIAARMIMVAHAAKAA